MLSEFYLILILYYLKKGILRDINYKITRIKRLHP